MGGARRLWVVSRVFPPDEGGVQTYARAVADGYAALGWRVTVFTKSSAGPARTETGGVAVIDVGPGAMAVVYGRLFRAMKRHRREDGLPDVIHACTWRAALPALPLGGRLIVAVHGREIGRPKGVAFRLMRAVLRRAARVVAVSGTTRTLLFRRLPELEARCVVAWNGATEPSGSVERPSAPIERPIELLTVCRLVERKNVRAAIDAVAGVRDIELRYRIAGRGPEEGGVRATIERHGIGDQVDALGFVEDGTLDRLYREADIFLHPQIALEEGGEIEGFGISVADAMAYGLPCIVGRDGGPAELIEEGVTGLIVDGRSSAAIGKAVELLVRSPELRAAMGGCARDWARANLSWERHCRLALAGIANG
ncbi:glycosyltransferase family 4 protein [uncultured Sphingomonas sp.]|uniref:glycosyltransferase family 4 protein n=1 Tax=uncultured Sphingomonas sp. TaxID=158754 RepID=UPI0035CBCC24